MHLDTLNWPTHQSPHQPTHVVSQSSDCASMSSHIPLSHSWSIDYRCQSLQARRADIIDLAVIAAGLPEYIITWQVTLKQTPGRNTLWYTLMLLGMRAATRQQASNLHGTTVSRQWLCSLHLPRGRIPAGHSQEMDVDRGSGTVRVCYAHLSFPACLSISVYMTVVALIIAVRRATCICARYHLISGRCDIVSNLSFTAAKNPQIRTNCGKVRAFVDFDANSESVTTLPAWQIYNIVYRHVWSII